MSVALLRDAGVTFDGRRVDVQLALYLCYEVHCAGLPGTGHHEWDVS